MNVRLLLIEDDAKLAFILKETLALYEFEVYVATDGVEGLKIFFEFRPDVVITDIMLPLLDGLNVLVQIRASDKKVPVVLLTSKTQTIDLVKGFELGCTDYIKKPFIMEELLARVRSLLRRSQRFKTSPAEEEVIEIGKYIVHLQAHQLRSPTQIYPLSYKEVEILKRLCSSSNRVLDRRSILQEVWGDDNLYNSKSLNVYITRLRNYFKEDEGIQIINLRSIGYKMVFGSCS